MNDSNAALILETEPSTEVAGRSHRVRSDIEGLRAIAVLSVLINHAFPRALPGGFAGVDIFFVISGYLIGKQLLQDIQAGRFSILRFYAKRARRIFPALALVLISVWIAGWLVFSAPEFAALGKHIVAAAAFSNNILLWTESGYFDTTALDKPLLHLWSLGIEEQFYLVVPAILWLGTRGAAGSIRWVGRLGALSLLATIFLSDFDYVASFYLLHTRFWELAAGVLLAQAELRVHAQTWRQIEHKSASKRDVLEIFAFSFAIIFCAVLALVANNDWSWQWNTAPRSGGLALAIAGAAAAAFLADLYTGRDAWNRACSTLIQDGSRLTTASSIAGISLTCVPLAVLSSANWPGPQTLFPVLGATLFIAATPAALSNRLLACRPFVFIGGISYPLYLWHWPAIVIFRMLNPEAPNIELAIPLAVSFALAWLTKTFLEEPARFGQLRLTLFRLPPLWPLVSGLAFAGLLGLSALVAGGLPSRFPPRLRAIAEWSQVNPYISWRAGLCYFDPHNSQDFSIECTPFKRPGVPLILLWGDSHAAQLYSGMADIQSTRNMDIAQWTAAACPPTVDPLLQESPTCATRRATAMNNLRQINPDTIVLGGAWERYLEAGESQQEISDALSKTIRRLKKLGVQRTVIFGPGPLWSTSLPTDLFRFMARSHSNEIPERLGRASDEIWRLDAALAALAAAENVQYVSVLNFFCDKDGCLTLGDKNLKLPDLLYWDREHLTISGSKLLITHSIPQWLGQN